MITAKDFKAFTVLAANYAKFNYCKYLKDNQEINTEMYSTYKVGDVVYIKSENEVGVVLGCIDEQGEEVRTDMCGMVSYSNMEFFNPFKHKPNKIHTTLLKELYEKYNVFAFNPEMKVKEIKGDIFFVEDERGGLFQYVTFLINPLIPVRDGKIANVIVTHFRGYTIKYNRNGVHGYSVWKGKKNLEDGFWSHKAAINCINTLA